MFSSILINLNLFCNRIIKYDSNIPNKEPIVSFRSRPPAIEGDKLLALAPHNFSVYDIKKIIKLNPRVIFLFQHTKDKRLISFIKKLGGITVEKKNNELYFFNDNDFIRIIRYRNL